MAAEDQYVPTGDILVDHLVEPTPVGAATKGWRTGVAGLKAAAQGAKGFGARLIGAGQTEQAALQASQDIQAQAAPDALRVEDVNSAGSALDFVKYAFSTAIPSMLLMGAGGGLGRGLGAILAKRVAAEGTRALLKNAGMVGGAALSSVGTEIGSIYPDAVEQGVENPAARAAVGGVAAGALDVLPGVAVARRLGLVADAASKPIRQAGRGAVLRAAAGDAAKGVAIEGGTEGLQTVIENIAAGKDLQNPEVISDILNSAVIGGIAGGGIGGGVGAVHALTAPSPVAPAGSALPAPSAPLATPDYSAVSQQFNDLRQLESLPVGGLQGQPAATAPGPVTDLETVPSPLPTLPLIGDVLPRPNIDLAEGQQPVSTTGPQQTPTEPASRYNRAAAPVADDADFAARDALVTQRDQAQARVAEIAAALPTAPRRDGILMQREATTLEAAIPALTSQIGALDAQIGNRARMNALPATMEAAPRTGTAEGTVIGAEPRDTTPAERGVAEVKRALGSLVTSREAALAPIAPTPALEVASERQPRSREKQVSDKERRQVVEGVAVQAIERHTAALEQAGGFKKGSMVKAREAVIEAAKQAASLPTVQEAEQAVKDAAVRALAGRVNQADAQSFADKVAADISTAPTFFSRAGQTSITQVALEDGRMVSVEARPDGAVWIPGARNSLGIVMKDRKAGWYFVPQGSHQSVAAVSKTAAIEGLVHAQYVTPTYDIDVGLGPVDSQQSTAVQNLAVDVYDTVLERRGQEATSRVRFLLGDDPNLSFDIYSNSRPYAGYYRALRQMKDVIGMSLRADTPSVADHESFHYLEMRVLDARERTLLARALSPGKPMFERVLEATRRYDLEYKTNITDEVMSDPAEARAYAFQFWRQGALETNSTLQAIFTKLAELLEKIANYLRGQGFQSAEDIFRAIDRGEYANRSKTPNGSVVRFARDVSDPVFAPDFDSFRSGMILKHPKMLIQMEEHQNGAVEFEFKVHEPGQRRAGQGRKAIQDLKDWADLNDRGLLILAQSEDPESFPQEKLEAWYARQGFEPVPSDIEDGTYMYRAPQGVADESTQVQGSQAGVGESAPTTSGAGQGEAVPGDNSLDFTQTQYSKAAVDVVPRAPFQQEAARGMDRQFTAGDLPREQQAQIHASAWERADLPNPTFHQLFGATKDQIVGGLTRFRQEHLASGNYLARFSEGYKNVQRVLTTFTQRKSQLFSHAINVQMSEWVNGASETDIQDVSKALLDRTVRSLQKGTADYQALYASLTEKQQRMFDQANTMVADMLQRELVADQRDMATALPAAEYAEWQAARVTRVRKLIQDGYIPERRYGDHVVHIYRPGDKDRLTMFYEQFDTEFEAKQALAQYQALVKDKDPSLTVEYGYKYKAERDTSLSLRQFFTAARRHGIELTQAERERLARAMIAADSVRLNRIFHRKNVPGYSKDGMRVLSEFALTMASKIAHSEYGGAVEDSLAGRPVDARTEGGVAIATTDPARDLWREDGPRSGFYRNLSDQLADFVLSPPQTGEWSRKLKSMASLYFLGGSLSFGLVNLTSMPLNTIPWLMSHSSYTDAASKTWSAFKLVSSNLSDLRNLATLQNRDAAIPAVDEIPGLRDALIQAAEDGTTADTEIHQLMGLTKGEELVHSRKVQKALDVWMLPFRLTEQLNRISTFVAAYKLGRETKSLTGRDLYKFAQDAVYNTQFRYDESNRPGFARDPLWSILFTFKSFPIYMIETIETLYKTNPRAAVVMLTGVALAAGVNGLPFAEDIMDVIDVIAQRLFGSTFQTKRALRNIAKDASEAIVGTDLSGLFLNGVVNDSLGLNLSTRVGLGNLIPGTRLGAADQDYKRTLEEILGPVGSLVTGAATGAGALLKGDFYQALQQGAPLAARNVAKGMEQLTTGEARDQRGNKLIDVNGLDAFWQTIGFSSGALNKAYEMDRMDKQKDAFYQEVREDFMKDFTKAIRDGDSAKVQEVLDVMNAWNERNPDMLISYAPAIMRRHIMEAGLPLNERTLRNLPKALRGTSVAIEGVRQ